MAACDVDDAQTSMPQPNIAVDEDPNVVRSTMRDHIAHPLEDAIEGVKRIEAVTREDLVQFHGICFVPERTVIAVYGDFATPAMKATLEKAFSAWAKSGTEAPPTPPYPDKTTRRVVFAPKDDVTQSAIVLAHPGFRADES